MRSNTMVLLAIVLAMLTAVSARAQVEKAAARANRAL
jgi:hypothetical protein